MPGRRASCSPIAVVGALLAGGVAADPPPLRVGLEADGPMAEHIRAHVEAECAPADRYVFFSTESPSRVEGELVLLCNALRLGGYDAPIEFVYAYSYNRSLAEAAAGRIDLPTQTVWAGDIAAHAGALISSAPVVAEGEWVVGLFTTGNRDDVLAVETPEAVRTLTAAAPRGWVEDWRALEALGLRRLIDVQENDLIPRMIAEGGADVTLLPFSRAPDMGREHDDPPVRLLPIRGLKLGFRTSRSFAISRARADAEAVRAAIDQGLAELRARGDLDAVLAAVGLREPRVSDWIDVAAPR